MFCNNICAAGLRTLGLARPVYVVTTRERHLFGMQRRLGGQLAPSGEELYGSHVFGFRDESHARLVAAALETYHRRHDRLPVGDLAGMDLSLDPQARAVELRQVAVEGVPLPDLLRRLRGTGIVVSLLTLAREDNLQFEVRDVRADSTSAAVVGALNRTWHAHRSRDVKPAAGVPRLLPKPTWPPDNEASAAELVQPMLAATALKCCALAEVMTLFWLLPDLF